MELTIVNVLLGVSCLTSVVLSTLMILRSRVQSSIFLSVSTYGAVLWIASELVFINARGVFFVTAAARSLHVAGAIILTSFVCFAYTFLGVSIMSNKKLLFSVLGLFVLFFCSIIFTEHIIALTEYSPAHFIQFGVFYPVYAFYIIMAAFFSYYFLFKKSLATKNKVEKVQLIYIGFGTIASLSIGLVLNIILPFFGHFAYYWFGPFLTIIFVTLAAYSILKHHLFNIKVISTELFSALIIFFVLVDALLAKTEKEFILKSALLAGVVFISILIIKSVFKEIESKEKIAKISEDLRLANIELRRLDEAKSEFLSIASHQLKTPLTVIKGYSSMVLEGEFGKITDKMKDVMGKIFQSSQRLVLMVDDFLNISRIEAGRMNYDFSNFDLKKLVADVFADFVANNKKVKKIKIEFISPDGEFFVRGDKSKIRQVLSNVIDNALHYTSIGFIKIFLSRGVEDRSVLVKVQDSGIGIAPEIMQRLFQKFARASEISRLHTDGSGLGLYVAKRIIEDHEGKIWAESAGLGKGSTFFIELPCF